MKKAANQRAEKAKEAAKKLEAKGVSKGMEKKGAKGYGDVKNLYGGKALRI